MLHQSIDKYVVLALIYQIFIKSKSKALPLVTRDTKQELCWKFDRFTSYSLNSPLSFTIKLKGKLYLKVNYYLPSWKIKPCTKAAKYLDLKKKMKSLVTNAHF